MNTLAYPHIEIRTDGVPYIAATRTKVVEIILWRMAYSWDADEIHRQHPDLSLAQIHSAFAYYHDHRDEIDADVRQRLRREQQILDGLGDSSQRRKLQAAKRATG